MSGGSPAAKGNILAKSGPKSMTNKQLMTVARVSPLPGRGNTNDRPPGPRGPVGRRPRGPSVSSSRAGSSSSSPPGRSARPWTSGGLGKSTGDRRRVAGWRPSRSSGAGPVRKPNLTRTQGRAGRPPVAVVRREGLADPPNLRHPGARRRGRGGVTVTAAPAVIPVDLLYRRT
jgi:hypothetical protein